MDDLLLFLGKGQWVDAAPVGRVLCVAAWIRCLAQTFPPLFYGGGKPVLAIYDAVLSLVLLCSTFFVSLQLWGDELGALIVAYAWLATYAVLIVFLWLFARKVAPVRVGAYLVALGPALGGAALLSACFAALSPLATRLPAGVAVVAMYTVAGVGAYATYLRYALGMTPRSLLAGSRVAHETTGQDSSRQE